MNVLNKSLLAVGTAGLMFSQATATTIDECNQLIYKIFNGNYIIKKTTPIIKGDNGISFAETNGITIVIGKDGKALIPVNNNQHIEGDLKKTKINGTCEIIYNKLKTPKAKKSNSKGNKKNNHNKIKLTSNWGISIEGGDKNSCHINPFDEDPDFSCGDSQKNKDSNSTASTSLETLYAFTKKVHSPKVNIEEKNTTTCETDENGNIILTDECIKKTQEEIEKIMLEQYLNPNLSTNYLAQNT